MLPEKTVDVREIGLEASCCHCSPLSQTFDIAGDLHGGDFERVDTCFSAELDEAGEGRAVVLVGLWLESSLEQRHGALSSLVFAKNVLHAGAP